MVLSLDCSTTAIGWSIFEDDKLIKYGRLTPSEKGLEWRDRVHNLLPQLEQLIKKYKPTKIYQEDIPDHNSRICGSYCCRTFPGALGVGTTVQLGYCQP